MNTLPSGNDSHSYGKWTIEIDDLPIKDGDVPIAMLVITRG